MDELLEIRQKLENLSKLDVELEKCEEWNSVAREIITKLGGVRDECQHHRFNREIKKQSTAESVSSACSSDVDSIYSEATEAYEQRIFSRCVRLIEGANRDYPVEMSLISMAHHSYFELVKSAQTLDDSLKFARWWAEFLDSVEAGRSHEEKAELLDYEVTALEVIVELSRTNFDASSMADFNRLLEVTIRSFQMISLLNRPYHLVSIQRLHKLSNILKKPWSKNSLLFSEAKSVVKNGIRNVLRDRQFHFKNGGRQNLEADTVLDEIIRISNFNLATKIQNFDPNNFVIRL